MICFLIVGDCWFEWIFDRNWLNLVLVPFKSIPKRKPNAKQIMHKVIVDITFLVIAIDDYYSLNSAVLVINKIIFLFNTILPFCNIKDYVKST